ncbi:phage tail protein [Lysinibacillus sp. FSL W8-0992]|uniref:phage tail protein n=1 Tax=Lysinibacillus sp. FSL W8-0992 TaxID=2954643 RepID=UPI0030FBB5FF
MSDAYLGEIRMFSGKYAPRDWELCNGQLLSVNEYQALFSLIGNKYGGDGVTNFALPDLRGRIPIHKSPEYPIASKGGEETVTLTEEHLPAHTHGVYANNLTAEATENSPANNTWGVSKLTNYQTNASSNIVQMNNELVSYEGGTHAHSNIMPSFVINFIIATQGFYPDFI